AALMHRIQDGAPGNLFEHDFRLCDTYAHGLEAAAAVGCPVHFIAGQRDVMTPPRAAAELARALRAQVLTVPAGHAMMQEAPDAVLRALRQAIPA
ncbi:MAG TPA: alpha/beta hydrolase, partial [Burkholderiaceae bacterium]